MGSRSRCSVSGASGAPKRSSGACPACTPRPLATRRATRPTRPTATCAAARRATPRSCSSSSIRRWCRYDELLRVFWESHDPTQGMRQGNDVGTQYRSGIYYANDAQREAAEASRDAFQEELKKAGYGRITTEILPAPEFYYAEDYHQQYLAKNPHGYCGLGGTGVHCAVGDVSDGPQCRSGRWSDLPVDPFRPTTIVDARSLLHGRWSSRPQPGAGKTTRIPPALVGDGPVILLQPRRAAARAIARRIADEQRLDAWSRGGLAGPLRAPFRRRHPIARRHRRRADRSALRPIRCSPRSPPSCSTSFTSAASTPIWRIALAKQAWRARSDLRIVVMSATLEAEAVAAYLDGCPVVQVPGRDVPAGDRVRAGADRWREAVVEPARRHDGDVLCFLPGAGEIRRAMASIEARLGPRGRRAAALRGACRRTNRTGCCRRRRRARPPDAAGSSSPPTSRKRRSPYLA